MVKVFKGTDHEYYLDGIAKDNLDTAKKVIKKDWDMIFAYDGYEGSGKSTKAIQDAFYCDPTLNLDRITFTPTEFRRAVMNAKQYQSVVYDEAYTGLSSRAAMTHVNRALVKMLAEIRQKNLFIFVVMPTFFDLDKYVALWRSRALVHIYTREKFERGYFTFYNVDRKKQLYVIGKKYYSYSKPKANFFGRFTKTLPIDEQKYKQKKRGSLIARERKAEEEEKKREMMGLLFEQVMALGENIPHRYKMQLLNMKPATYYRKMKDYKEKDGIM